MTTSLLIAIASASSRSTAIAMPPDQPGAAVVVAASPILPMESPPADTLRLFRSLVSDVLEACLPSPYPVVPDVVHVVLSASGDTPPILKEALLRELDTTALRHCKALTFDWIPRGQALRWAAHSEHAACAVIKVGSTAFVQAFPHERGRHSIRVGGWGALSGEDGGGYWLGRQLLYRAFREYDQRDSPSALITSLLARSDAPDIFALRQRLLSHGDPVRVRIAVANLASFIISSYAASQDALCKALISNAADHVLALFNEAARLTPSNAPSRRQPVLLHGAIVRYCTLFRSLITSALLDRLDVADVNLVQHTLLYGALRYGLSAASQPPRDLLTDIPEEYRPFLHVPMSQ